MSDVIELPLPSRGPCKTAQDRAYLATMAELSKRYGYKWQPDPIRRKGMPMQMLWDLGFRHAAIEFTKQATARDRRAQWGR